MRKTASIVCAILSAATAYAQIAAFHENLHAVLWTQRSAEYKSIAWQTYQSARLSLQAALRDHNWTAALEQDGKFADLPPAIILDLDETVFDNSTFEAQLMFAEPPLYTEARWQQWVDKEQALAIPGAVEFLNYARSEGVTPFYITNRVCNAMAPTDHTVVMLQKLLIPFKPGQLLCRTDSNVPSDKSLRRAAVASTHRVLLMFGDDLGDFVSLSSVHGDWKAKVERRDALAQAYRDFWGAKWFLLPDPMYGSWERVFGDSVAIKREALRR